MTLGDVTQKEMNLENLPFSPHVAAVAKRHMARHTRGSEVRKVNIEANAMQFTDFA